MVNGKDGLLGKLNRDHFQAVRSGAFRGYSDRAIGWGKPNDCRLLDKGGTVIRVQGAEVVSRFGFNDGHYNFSVFADLPTDKAGDEIGELIKEQISRLNGNRRKIYEELFGQHAVGGRALDYDGVVHDGTIVIVPVKEIPLGQKGGLSERIFVYAHNIYERPALAIGWRSLPGGEFSKAALQRWKDFSAP